MKNKYSYDYLFDADFPNIEVFRAVITIAEIERQGAKEDYQLSENL